MAIQLIYCPKAEGFWLFDSPAHSMDRQIQAVGKSRLTIFSSWLYARDADIASLRF